MVQRDLMSVLMFIEDTTLAASGQAQEVNQLKISSGTLNLEHSEKFCGISLQTKHEVLIEILNS